MLQIVWKQKHKSEHGTCDKKIGYRLNYFHIFRKILYGL